MELLGQARAWSQCNALGQWSPAFLAPGTDFMEDSLSTDGGRGLGMVRAVMQATGAADEVSLAHPPLTFCCAAQGLGTPALQGP